MTEHSVYLVQPYGVPLMSGSCGQALPGQKIAILREDGSEADSDEVGILASHRTCPGLMLGYRDQPFNEEWFLSGDLAKRDAAGNFYFLGRRDDVLTAGGYRISPAEVEHALQTHPAIAEAAVIQAQSAEASFIKAFIVLASGYVGSTELQNEILHCLGEKLARYKCPRELCWIDQLPKTAHGKLQRKLLRDI